MKVNIVSPQPADANKITKELVYSNDAQDPSRLVTAPMGLAGVTDALFPARVAYKRSSTEIKNGRRRILVEDTVPLYLKYDELAAIPDETTMSYVKIHTVLELPFTTPVQPGTSLTNLARLTALRSALMLHAQSLLPNLVTTGADNTGITGVKLGALTGTEDEYVNSPFVRGTHGLAPFGDSQELGLADSTVE